jgi:1-acyl-sn-glycerol-3-phosphate acyltransferase
MDKAKYRDIAPYDPAAVAQAIDRLRNSPQFIIGLGELLSSDDEDSKKAVAAFTAQLPALLDKVKTYEDFQRSITAGVMIPTILRKSVDKFSFSGAERLDTGKPFLFISNHRDIVLDCTLLDYALLQSGMMLCEMAIGDNLLVNQFATDLFKLNGGITVKRELPMREKYLESIRLSEYFIELITEERQSIWVAQKSGRSKDGIDTTNAAIIKMLYLSKKKTGVKFSDLIKSCNIVPVAISYEYDPCDINKGREEVSKLLHGGEYQKKKYEDLLNMLRGLRKYKGNIHLAFGKPLVDDYETPEEVAREIDRQIHLEYRLWDTNCFAYDYLEGTDRFSDRYADLDTERFLERYKGLKTDVREFVLNSYANPVRSYLAEADA